MVLARHVKGKHTPNVMRAVIELLIEDPQVPEDAMYAMLGTTHAAERPTLNTLKKWIASVRALAMGKQGPRAALGRALTELDVYSPEFADWLMRHLDSESRPYELTADR